ncbi:MAG: hypothetical protein H6726_12525 [Sandaracinaceae bacterium]|nr:hypothetical protein [Sandaracinaceae bacterium]
MTIPTDMLAAVEPRQAAAWLRANGWELVDVLPDRAATWRKNAGAEGEYVVELPLSTSFRDYARRMREVLDTLVIATGKPAAWVLGEVRASTFDIIRLRSTGPGVGQGRVPVELGARLFGLTRDLVLAAACSAHDPRPVYRTRRPPEAMEFLRRVKLGPPEEGSFVVTVHAPVPPALQPMLFDEHGEVPFERRATLTLASATMAARAAAERAGQGGGAEGLLDGAALGISANLCDALAGFVDGDETTALDLQFAWAASRLVPAGTPTALHVGSDLSPILREGARLLRARGSTPDFELEGAVVRLDSDNLEAGGVVVIAGQVDGQPRKVHVPMDAADYRQAIRAHDEGRFLRCEGELGRQGRRFQIDRVRHVAVVVDDED